MAFCSQCGAQLRPGARFCESCGQAVAAAAAEPTPPPAAPAPQFAEPAPQAWAPALAEPAKPKRSRRGLVAGVGGVAAVGVLGVVGYFVYDALAGPAGGAESPQAAVVELAAAADSEDAATALSLLPPGEVGPIVDLYADVEAKATSTGVAAEDHPFAGFDLHLDGLGVQTEQLGEDVAAVTVTSGTVSWTLDPAQLQGPLRIDSNGNERHATEGSADLVEISRNASNGAPVRLMTVQREGKWYVSPMYTLLELWRVNRGLPAPDFSQELDLEGTGAESSTAAVEEAVQALAGYDVDGFLDLLSPDEAAAFYQYRDAIVTALHQDGQLAELQAQAQLTVDSIDATEGEEVDDRVPVTVRSAAGTLIDDDGDYFNWTLDRNCLSYTENGDADGGCLDQIFQEAGLGADLASHFQSLTLLTQEVDGRWYLSPLATLVSDARSAVADLDTDEVVGALGVPQFGSVDVQLEEGETAEIDLQDPSGTGLAEMDVPAGKVFSVCTGDGNGSEIYGPDGRPSDASAVLAVDGGRYRAVVNSGGESVTVPVTPVLTDVEQVSVPATVPAAGDCGWRLLSVEAEAGVPLVASTSDNYTVQFIPADGEASWGTAYVPEENGTLLVSVPVDQEVTLDTLPDDVLVAGSSTSGSFGAGGSATVQIFVQSGDDVSIDVVGLGTTSPYAEVYSADGTLVDQEWAGYYSASVTLFLYGYDAQIYTVVVSDGFGEAGTFDLTVNDY